MPSEEKARRPLVPRPRRASTVTTSAGFARTTRTAPGTAHAPAPVAALARPARPATLLVTVKCRVCRKAFGWRSTRTAGGARRPARAARLSSNFLVAVFFFHPHASSRSFGGFLRCFRLLLGHELAGRICRACAPSVAPPIVVLVWRERFFTALPAGIVAGRFTDCRVSSAGCPTPLYKGAA